MQRSVISTSILNVLWVDCRNMNDLLLALVESKRAIEILCLDRDVNKLTG